MREVNALWPGRAGITPILDLLMTLLHWGRSGWDCIRAQRQAMFEYLGDRLQALAEHLGERVLLTPRNHISIALTLDVLQVSRKNRISMALTLDVLQGGRGNRISAASSRYLRLREEAV